MVYHQYHQKENRGLITESLIFQLLHKPNPKAEKHSVKRILEDIRMQNREPFRMELDEERYNKYTQYIKCVAADQAERNKPQFVFPSSLNGQDQANPYETLLKSGTSPYDGGAASRLKTDYMIAAHISRITKEADEPVHHPRDMARHEFKRRCNINTEPCDDIAVFIPHHGELPEIVRHQQCHHEDDDIFIGF